MVAGRNDLVVGLELDSRGFARGADSVSNRMNRMGREARNFGGTASKGFGRANRGLLELSRGAEDFAISFGTGGVSGGLRGAANNISQFASMIHPLAGAFAGVGVAAVAMWTSFNKGADDAIKKTKELDALSKRVKDFQKGRATQGGFAIDMELARGGIGAVDGPFEGRRITKGDIGVQRRKLENEQAQQAKLQAERNIAQRGADSMLAILNKVIPGYVAPKSLADITDDTDFAEEQRSLLKNRQRVKTLDPLLESAAKSVAKEQRALQLAETTRARQGAVGEGAGISQQRREFQASLEARRQAARDRKREFQAEQRERSLMRQGGTMNVMGPMSSHAPQAATPAGLASIATKGSAGAARAIAEAKNQSSTQKAQLDELKKQTELLKNTSQTAQADVVIESFGSVA